MNKAIKIFLLSIVLFHILQLGYASETPVIKKLKLSDLVAAVKLQSPDFLASKALAQKKAAEKTANGFLSAPEVGISWMGENSPFKTSEDSSSKPSYYLKQKMPFPTTWIKRNRAYGKASSAAKINQRATHDEVVVEIEELFWQYVVLFEEVKLFEEDHKLLKSHLKDATYRPVRNELMRAHLYQLREEEAVRGSQIKLARVKALGTLLKIRKITGIPKKTPTSNALLNPTYPKLTSHQKIIENIEDHPAWLASVAEVNAKSSLVDLEKTKYMPTFDLSYRLNSEDTPMPNSHQLTVGLTLPFAYFWQTSASVSEKRAELKIAQANQTKTKRMLENHMAILNEKFSVLKSLIEDYQNKIIPTSKKRFNYLKKLSGNDMETLMQKLNSSRELLKRRQKLLHLRAEYESAIAHLKHFGVNGDNHVP